MRNSAMDQVVGALGDRARRTRARRETSFRIPSIWNCWGYEGVARSLGRELVVDPAKYLLACVDRIRAAARVRGVRSGRSLSRVLACRSDGGDAVDDNGRVRRAGDWIRAANLYGMLVRTSSAWDHNGDGNLGSAPYRETGTFLKSILLLPLLMKMSISAIYMLPVGKVSRIFLRGDMGCPYAAKNFLEIEPDLHDPLAPDVGVETQFAAFVECAHLLGMRVIIDVAPRTMGRDSDWILDHPEWFYWIDRRMASRYRAPTIPGVTYINPIPRRLSEIYNVPAVQEHLRMFRFDPGTTHREKWARFAARMKARPPKNLLDETARHFGVITPPGFSDAINDTQPAWTDVTYLRLFRDHPTHCVKQLPEPARQPPYVLFDTVKSSVFEGRHPYTALWNRLADVIPFYQRFGVDGARVDMAHALPPMLARMILERARDRDPDFCFVAEDLGTARHEAIRRDGYNLMVGPSWFMEPRAHEGLFHKMVEQLRPLKVPAIGAAETPDTPRAVIRKGGARFSRLAGVLNNFLPNAVPMIHSGMEVFERQPINLGLDNVGPGRRALPNTDPQAGRLGMFDRYALHWLNRGVNDMVTLLARAAELRSRFIEPLTRPRAYFAPRVGRESRWVLATGFVLGRGGGCLLIVANMDVTAPHSASISRLPARVRQVEVLLEICSSRPPRLAGGRIRCRMQPGDVKVLRVS